MVVVGAFGRLNGRQDRQVVVQRACSVRICRAELLSSEVRDGRKEWWGSSRRML
jgi:hypothetical protein